MKSKDSENNKMEILIEEYKLYVEMMDRTSSRRNDANKFYITILSSILGIFALLIENNVFVKFSNWTILIISVLGMILCILWSVNIQSYKQINSLKFLVIHELEELLPFPCYTKEWDILKEGKKQYRRLTTVENILPFIFVIPYFLLLIYLVADIIMK